MVFQAIWGDAVEVEERAVANRPYYSAFISYSHADAAAVQKLHRRLESYRLPKGLGRIDALNAKTGTRGRLGLGKVFRDREELSAAESLSDAVTDALTRSEVLIVACSPDAKASHWVGQEIAFFREHCSGRPILAAIVRGEPAEAFPEALTAGGVEPLAADLRKEGDGAKLGFLKVVAGIAGVPLDALVQRESQRQMRRVMAVTGVVAVLALVMGAMTMFAIQSRNEAQSLRQNSDAFLSEFLTDGRQDLIGVGRLDIQDRFNDRALRFYERLGDPSALPSDSLINWATILHDIGEDEARKVDGDLDKADTILADAFRATSELMERDADDPDHIYAHGQSTYWVGHIKELRGEFAAADKDFRTYRTLSQRLAKVEPKSFRAATELGFGELNPGIIRFEFGRMDDAAKSFDAAIKHLAQADKRKPGQRVAQEGLANARAWRFNVYYNEGDFERALDQRRKSAVILRQIAARYPEDKEAEFSLLVAKRAIAMTQCQLGEGESARRGLVRVEQGLEQLVEHDPDNSVWSGFLETTRADVERISGKENCSADSN